MIILEKDTSKGFWNTSNVNVIIEAEKKLVFFEFWQWEKGKELTIDQFTILYS